MGWWQTPDGVWGDETADVIDEALTKIEDAFMREWGRIPTQQEIISGVYWSVVPRYTDPPQQAA